MAQLLSLVQLCSRLFLLALYPAHLRDNCLRTAVSSTLRRWSSASFALRACWSSLISTRRRSRVLCSRYGFGLPVSRVCWTHFDLGILDFRCLVGSASTIWKVEWKNCSRTRSLKAGWRSRRQSSKCLAEVQPAVATFDAGTFSDDWSCE